VINYTRSIGTAALLGVAVLLANTGTSHAARDACDYYAGDDAGKKYAHGHAKANKMSTACDRARRECNRRLERAYRRGEVPRGVRCVRLEEVR
jgi:hypothetical protein